MYGCLIGEDFPHVAKVAPVVTTTRVPKYNVHILQERVIRMLGHIQIDKVTKMVIHIDARVQLYNERGLIHDYVALLLVQRALIERLEQLKFRVPRLERTLVVALGFKGDRVQFAATAYLARLENVFSVAIVGVFRVEIGKVKVDILGATHSGVIHTF